MLGRSVETHSYIKASWNLLFKQNCSPTDILVDAKIKPQPTGMWELNSKLMVNGQPKLALF